MKNPIRLIISKIDCWFMNRAMKKMADFITLREDIVFQGSPVPKKDKKKRSVGLSA